MTQRNAGNTGWDELFPMTKNEQIIDTLKMIKSGKDGNGIFTTVEYKRPDNTLAAKAVLSGGTSPKYTTRTVTYYAPNGSTVTLTKTFTLSYDADDDLISEV